MLPVKLIMSTSRDSTSASPVAGLDPVTTFTTPGGKPTSSRMRTSSITASGSCGAGRTITVLPIASAGPILPAMLTIGKLYGVMHATTPTGARRASAPMRPAGAIGVAGISCGASGMTLGSRAPRAYRSNRLAATGTCIARPDGGRAPRLRDHEGHEILELLAHADGGRRQELGALLGRRLRPRLERIACGPSRVVCLLHGRFGCDADNRFRRRVDDVVAAVAAVDPLAADQKPFVRRDAHALLPATIPKVERVLISCPTAVTRWTSVGSASGRSSSTSNLWRALASWRPSSRSSDTDPSGCPTRSVATRSCTRRCSSPARGASPSAPASPRSGAATRCR